MYHIYIYIVSPKDIYHLLDFNFISFSAGNVFIRQNLTSTDVCRRQILTYKDDGLFWLKPHNIGIQMKRRKLNNPFNIF